MRQRINLMGSSIWVTRFALEDKLSNLDSNYSVCYHEKNLIKEAQGLLDKAFYITKLDDKIFARIDGKSYKKNCPLPLSELRYLHVLHKDLSGKILEGELICNVRIAEPLTDIFRNLFTENYPIEKIRLIDEYEADDELSMRDNNSSCFNFRYVSFTNRISLHGYGLAVDINPLYNPYIKVVDGKKIIAPDNSVAFEDRTKDFPYKITEDDLCCRLFAEHGFKWGGRDLPDEFDYQHFFIEEGITR